MAVDDAYTKLLLHCDGADASTTFTDEAGKTITVVGNAQIDTAQSKFGGASGLFDGTGDYIYAADSADWNFGTGDFTIDFWVRFNAINTYNYLFSQRVNSSNFVDFSLYSTDGGTTAYFQFSGYDNNVMLWNYYTLATTVAVNTWYHVAVVRNGTSWKTYLNGTNVHSQTGSFTAPDLAASFVIGARGDDFASPLNGWIDEFRVTKGLARWTANFTVPPRAYEPVETDDSNTKFLLHMDGVNASTTFTDSATTPKTVTAVGNAQISTAQKEFGTASGLFDGVGDCLTVPDSDDWAFGTGDFTIDMWFYLTTFSSQYVTLVSQGPDSNNYFQIQILENGANDYAYIAEVAGGSVLTTGGGSLGVNIAINTWYHFAVVRLGGEIKFYVNGVNNLTVTGVTGSFANHTGNFVVGRNDYNTSQYVYGYMDELRVSKGIARWFGNFAVPTVAYAGVVPPAGPANVKTINGIPIANIKTINGIPIANIKSINGLQ